MLRRKRRLWMQMTLTVLPVQWRVEAAADVHVHEEIQWPVKVPPLSYYRMNRVSSNGIVEGLIVY